MNTSYSQPEHWGCHFHKSQHPQRALTPEEQADVEASIARSDTFDILNYAIDLDVTAFSDRTIYGACIVDFVCKLDGSNVFSLDLLDLPIDSIIVASQSIDFTRDGFRVNMPWPTPLMQGDTHQVTVYYHGTPTVSESTFGGFYFEGGYAYNLGIDLVGMPHNFGRSWFPCFDNFVERSTYDIQVTTANRRVGYAVGRLTQQDTIQGDTIRRTYRLDQPIPTYLASVAVSEYVEHNSVHQGAYGDIPVQIIARNPDLGDARSSLAFLPDAIDCLEYWYGPYIWDRVGYVMTTRGAMEHAANIAYPVFSINGGQLSTRLMTHELCHHWWGNTTTPRTAQDMWIKEGNAEYGAHLIEEFIGGAEDLRETVRNNHRFVLLQAHVNDGDYIALSPLSQEHTYGTHTYYRGASMMHNMRAYLGDSLFRAGQQAILERYKFQAMNAATYRDALTDVTGYDMSAFFDDWIFGPGYADFFVYQHYLTDDDRLAIVIHQQRYQSLKDHTDVPLPIRIYLEDGSYHDTQVVVSGVQDTAYLSTDEMSDWSSTAISVGVNIGHHMNLAMFESSLSTSEPTSQSESLVKYDLEIEQLNGLSNASFGIELHLTSPYGTYDSTAFLLADNHMWHTSGNLDQGIQGTLSLDYDGGAQLAPASNLVDMGEQNLTLLYRPDALSPWVEHPDYNVIRILPNDGRGRVDIYSNFIGDFVLANRLQPVNTIDRAWDADIVLSPNPTSDLLILESEVPLGSAELYDQAGRTIARYDLGGRTQLKVDVSGQQSGTQYLYVQSADNRGSKTLPFTVVR